jgi:hypothetical protein
MITRITTDGILVESSKPIGSSRSPMNSAPPVILIDAHVHFHGCFDWAHFIDSAHRNFSDAAAHDGAEFIGVLLFTETSADDRFGELLEFVRNEEFAPNDEPRPFAGDWRLYRTEESCSLIARAREKRPLVIVAGRQIVTAERLEVLALGTDSKFSDGKPIEQVLDTVASIGAVPVIPWGFGKWTGHRGRIVQDLLETQRAFLLGDNSGRPSLLPYPSQFIKAERRGIRILPGSDPLPFSFEAGRAGSYGFRLRAPIDLGKPAREIRRMLRDPSIAIESYGAQEQPVRFLRNQIAMQLRILMKGRAPRREGAGLS